MRNDSPTVDDRREMAARWLAYLSPYLFWSLVCVMTCGIWLLA